MVFDLPDSLPRGSMAEYVANEWEDGKSVQNVQTFQANGMEAATGWCGFAEQSTRHRRGMVAIRYDANHVYRFTFIAPPEGFDGLTTHSSPSARSFRQTSAGREQRLCADANPRGHGKRPAIRCRVPGAGNGCRTPRRNGFACSTA